MNVFELFAKLGLDTSEYEKGLEGAESSASSFGANLKKGIGVAAGVTTAAITATTAATVAGTKAFVEGVSTVAEYGDRIDKLSQKLNMSATGLQEWDFVMQHCGASIDSMQASIKTLSSAAETNNEAFERLGMTEEEIAAMSGEELFNATITALQGVEDETERTYLAGQLLGRGATELGALLNMSAEETAQMKEQVHDLGGVLSDDAVKDAAQFQDSLQNMQTSFDGLKNSMLTQFLPSFSTVMDGLSLVFSGDSEKGLGMIETGVGDLADRISEVAPRFIQIGGTILTALASSITDNLPVLLQSGAEAISQIGTGLIANLPAIIPAGISVIETIGGSLVDHLDDILNAGIEILLTITDGIASKSDAIIPTIVSVIHKIVGTLSKPDVAVPLVRGGLQIITGLAQGLAEATPELVGMIPELIGDLILTLIEVFPDIVDAVLSLLGSLALSVIGSIGGLMGMSYEEIETGIVQIFDGVEQFGQDVLAWFTSIFDGDLLGDVGTFFTDLFEDFTGGFDDVFGVISGFGTDVLSSFTETFENVKDTVKNAVDKLLEFFDFDWSLPQLKLPHFSVTGGEAPWGFGGQGSLPKVDIQWYKKAMNSPYLLDSATIFGAANGHYLGGGEAGTEMIYSHERLLNDIASVVDSKFSNLQLVANIYIGGKKIDQQIVTANARNTVVSGGR